MRLFVVLFGVSTRTSFACCLRHSLTSAHRVTPSRVQWSTSRSWKVMSPLRSAVRPQVSRRQQFVILFRSDEDQVPQSSCDSFAQFYRRLHGSVCLFLPTAPDSHHSSYNVCTQFVVGSQGAIDSKWAVTVTRGLIRKCTVTDWVMRLDTRVSPSNRRSSLPTAPDSRKIVAILTHNSSQPVRMLQLKLGEESTRGCSHAPLLPLRPTRPNQNKITHLAFPPLMCARTLGHET